MEKTLPIHSDQGAVPPLGASRPEQADQAAAARSARKGRPRIGAGAARINVTVEQTLLQDADAYARDHGMTRAALVSEGLRRILTA